MQVHQLIYMVVYYVLLLTFYNVQYQLQVSI